MTSFPAELLAAWGIDAYASAVPPASGTMNETWLVDLGHGSRVVLRRHRRTERVCVEYEHAVIASARAGGVPCPSILSTVDGSPLVEAGGRLHSLYSWAPGEQCRRGELSPGQARSAGETLAGIHDALRHHPAGPWADDPPYDPVAIDARLRALAGAVTDVAWLSAELTARRDWLASHPEEPPAGRRQVVHGDYQETNVLFTGDAVSAVIDWDKARPEWPAWEVVRTLDYAIGLEPVSGSAFIDGYRSARSLPPEELEAAAARWGHHTAHEVWLYEEVYVRGNSRAAGLIDTRPWVPFVARWVSSGLK